MHVSSTEGIPLMLTKCSFINLAVSSFSKDSCSITWHQLNKEHHYNVIALIVTSKTINYSLACTITDTQENGLVLSLGLLNGLFTPWIPIDLYINKLINIQGIEGEIIPSLTGFFAVEVSRMIALRGEYGKHGISHEHCSTLLHTMLLQKLACYHQKTWSKYKDTNQKIRALFRDESIALLWNGGSSSSRRV